ncbi:MAG: single-stranded-DNA-specific exonuclease RecJ [Candidatus Doudnabacteria bacterium]|nr:single-stranded-DNA-specific exonuclease RecJ [Candidatus Doudnabacteria bacterium]
MKRKWIVKEKISDELIKKFPDHDRVILQLLFNRGLTSESEQDYFLNPQYERLISPFAMSGMQISAARLLSAIADQEKITIYADYDADAVTACVVLYRFLSKLGARIDWYIPDRFDEGYGLNQEAIKSIADRGTRLIVTVDCGINALDEVIFANSLGVDVIVTDHHYILGNLPPASSVINPKLDDLPVLAGLTGVGVAFKLVQALIALIYSSEYQGMYGWKIPEIGSKKLSAFLGHARARIVPGWEKWLLDLVAIGTIADCQSLMGENRILVKYGLSVIGKTKWPGLWEIVKNAGISEYANFDSYSVGFIIAPRINAAGRIQHADIAFRLLATDNPTEAAMYAGQVESLNLHRQRLTEQILSEAKSIAEGQQDRKVLLAAGVGWPRGVVGLVAARLVENYQRPAIVLEKGAEVATGSARSWGSFNIVKALSGAQKYLERFGGHAAAAGLTLKNEFLDDFHNHIDATAGRELAESDFSRQEFVDFIAEPEQITDALLEELKNFEPFGPDNPPVTVLLQDLTLEQTRLVGATGKHLKLQATKNDRVYEFIGFGKAQEGLRLAPGENLEVVVEPSHNHWNGLRRVQLKIRDLRKTSA